MRCACVLAPGKGLLVQASMTSASAYQIVWLVGDEASPAGRIHVSERLAADPLVPDGFKQCPTGLRSANRRVLACKLQISVSSSKSKQRQRAMRHDSALLGTCQRS